MKIYEWKNILCSGNIESSQVLSNEESVSDQIISEFCTSLHSEIKEKKVDYFFANAGFFDKQGWQDKVTQLFKQLSTEGRLIVIENKRTYFLQRNRLRKKIFTLIAAFEKENVMEFREYVAIPSIENPKCICLRDDNDLYSFIFGKFLLSYSVKKRLIYKVLHYLTALRLHAFLDMLFPVVYVVVRKR
ncbi:MAG: hypothetical protein ACTSWC_10905 [Promethearchaeota archaeon]